MSMLLRAILFGVLFLVGLFLLIVTVTVRNVLPTPVVVLGLVITLTSAYGLVDLLKRVRRSQVGKEPSEKAKLAAAQFMRVSSFVCLVAGVVVLVSGALLGEPPAVIAGIAITLASPIAFVASIRQTRPR